MTEDKRPVYRMVDGALARVPGDKRDPASRYHTTDQGQGHGQCDIEFTDAEETERDLEEAKWEEEKPQRIADAKRQEEEYNDFKNSLIYEDRIIAYLDILGWSEAITRSANDQELTKKLGIGLDFVKKNIARAEFQQLHNFPNDLHMTQFSDSIIISMKAEHIDFFSFSQILNSVNSIIRWFLPLGFLVRGAITSGLLIHRGSVIYGPALVEAYTLESKKALWPRVIFDRHIAASLGDGTKVTHKNGDLIGYKKDWRVDKDGWAFLDFLQPLIRMPGIPVNFEHLKAELKPFREFINNGVSKHKKNPEVYPKYEWMALYFNEILLEYKEVDINPIDV